MLLKTAVRPSYINVNSGTAFRSFTNELLTHIRKGIMGGYKSIVFVCIGTDRSTGDSLGPLIGYKLANMKHNNVYVYGNLDMPVHAKNLDEVMEAVYKEHNRPFIIAIDACLGVMDHVGYLAIGEGAIKPGSGVNKDLAPVGDIYITGIVNFGGFMDFLILQNTRLSIVMKMADLISSGIRFVLWKISSDPEVSSLLHNTEV
jgi:putative sporulation protein YyaC